MTSISRNLVVMFADVSGSAALFEKLGDVEAQHAVERCLKRMTRSIDGYKGRTTQVVGDELLALFESAEKAFHAAVDMQQRIADLPPVSGLKLTIRIGLHFGEVIEGEELPKGAGITTAARITGMARRNQILCSSRFIAELPPYLTGKVIPMPSLGSVEENMEELPLSQIEWSSFVMGDLSSVHSTFGAATPIIPRNLSLHFHGKSFLLDERTPSLSIGRDLSNQLVIDDRKASRQHARIERRSDGYYLIDTSTNGSFLDIAGHQELMVRRHEVMLKGKGRISFGAPNCDPEATSAEFEAF